MKQGTCRGVIAVLVLNVLCVSMSIADVDRGNVVAFDAPGADTTAGSYGGTFATGINNTGTVTGYFVDADSVYHGFIRTPDGTVITLDAPGADHTTGSYNGTFPSGVNDKGVVTGNLDDAKGTSHGFLRSASGKYTVFDVPGAGGFTQPIGLNAAGAVVGYYSDANLLIHAFLRRPDGTFKKFVGPNSCTGSPSIGCYGSAAFSINIFGTIAGAFEDDSGNFVDHGLVLSSEGKLTTYDVPVAGMGMYQGTGCPGCAPGLNSIGEIAGIFTDETGVFHGYIRNRNGRFSIFDAPGAGGAPGQGTGCFSDCSVSLNDLGELTGNYIDSNNGYHGFLRDLTGRFVTIDGPDSAGTFPAGINEAGAVTGYFLDDNNVNHSFIRLP